MQVGKTLVLYRAREQRLLTLLRSLSLSILVPYLQRLVRGHLARECVPPAPSPHATTTSGGTSMRP